MTGTNVYEVQSKFSKIHIPFFFLFAITLVVEDYSFEHIYTMAGLLLLLPNIILNIIGYKKRFFNNSKYTYCVRYLEIITATCAFTFTNKGHLMAIALFFYCAIFIEFVLLYDYSDPYYRVISTVVAILPAILSIIFATLFEGNFTFQIFVKLLIYLCVTGVLAYYCVINEKVRSYLESQLFKQNRLLVDLNEINESLRQHQDKLKKVNDELGYKKAMLESAYKRINDSNIEIRLQNQVLKYISSSLDINELMELTTSSLYHELHLEVCALAINREVINNTRMIYRIKTSSGEEYERNLSNYISNGTLCAMTDNNMMYVDNHVTEEKYEFTRQSSIGSFVIAPLIQDEKKIGYLFVGSKKYEYFIDNTAFYEAIVAQIILAVKNANLYAKMQEMAIRDSLTGVYNRGHLTVMLDDYIQHALSKDSPITLALIDIDKFKKINDTYGHLVGDQIIREVGALAREIANEQGGIVGRYGGEEFVVAFPNKNLQEAYKLIDEIRLHIKEKEILHNNTNIRINVSVGITAYPDTCKNPYELLNRADWAMYYSKQNGRDMITIDSDEVREKVLMK